MAAELSFNDQTAHHGKVDDISEDEGYCEKHVTIDDDDLPVVYKTKSYNIPDEEEDTGSYDLMIHQHPVLKFSISSSNIDINSILPYSQQETTSCSPFTSRRNKVISAKNSPLPSSKTSDRKQKWTKHEVSRNRGKTFPPYIDPTVNKDTLDASTICHPKQEKDAINTKEESSSNTNNRKSSSKWLHYLKKINPFPKKFGNKSKNSRKRRISGSFHDLPPIRVCASMSNLDQDETNNNNIQDNKLRHDADNRLFTLSKTYRPASECIRQTKLPKDDTLNKVSLKRVNSLPIL